MFCKGSSKICFWRSFSQKTQTGAQLQYIPTLFSRNFFNTQ